MSASAGFAPAQADEKLVTIGIELPLTGADADSATRIKNGAMMAIEDANGKGGAGGYKLAVTVLDSGTSTAGQYDPAQAATNAKKFVADPSVVAIVGPEMSGEGKAMTPILSAANLAADHAVLDQSRHHRSEVRRPVQAGRQGDLFPHGHDGRLSGPEHGQLHARHPEGEVGLYPR